MQHNQPPPQEHMTFDDAIALSKEIEAEYPRLTLTLDEDELRRGIWRVIVEGDDTSHHRLRIVVRNADVWYRERRHLFIKDGEV